ncbi:MAG: hypothetical protein GW886_01660, partial [Rhodobacterales bacterium]|nr:hypothetical protein [Rhodobacterales bacterium]
FTIGAAELAVKPITDVSITLSWSGLPRAAGGFETHYRDYGPNFTPPRPQLAVSWLAQGGARSLGPPQSMLRETPGEARLAPDRTLRFAAPGAAAVDRDAIRRIAAQGEGPLASGAVRIELRCGEDAFGHAAYPAALAAALRPSYNPLRRRASPSPPHTPTIDRVTLNYRAEDVIDLGAPHAAAPDQRLRHITPFGTREIFPGRADMSAGVFAERLADGALFLQIAGPPPVGALSLLFHLEESSHRRLGFTPKPVRWRYLAQDGWRPLGGSTLVSDSTDGLMRSGVVRIAPPADAARRSSEMPGEGLWLAACADGNLGDLPRLRSVMVNGARAVRVLDGEDTPDPPGPRKWRLAVDAGRVADVRWVAETVSGAAPETERAFHTRVAERLRHRQRAVTSWDVERLALELFPQVWKAKCFPVMDPHTGRERPGAVTLIVVPHAPAGVDRDPARPRMFDVLTLRRIEETLAALAPDGARLTVGNPSYDRLQVRARVVFARDRDDGSLIQRLERDVSRMLSVWTAAAPMNGFGWSISLNEVAGFMAALDYIDFVTRLSLLQLSRDDAGRHQLRDTARSALGARASLRWDRPWSLPLATRLHRITAGGLREAEPPAAAGLGALAVGAMLVVGSGAQ